MYNHGWEETKRWNLERAYPITWKGPSLKADSKKVAIETLTIAFHGLSLEENV
jgi:phage tail-like protein